MTATQSVTLERVLDAPIDLVWQMWTDPEHFAAWYGPTGASVPVIETNLTVGGTRHFCIEMQTPDGQSRMWFVGEYRVIDPPTRLVYTESMSDPDGNRVSPETMGMPDGHPEVTEVTVELTDADGRTRMVMTHAGIPADSPGAMGWNMALDKLEAHLAPGTDRRNP
jgi:uncharacterized protein YndB with AHSA1/START domain